MDVSFVAVVVVLKCLDCLTKSANSVQFDTERGIFSNRFSFCFSLFFGVRGVWCFPGEVNWQLVNLNFEINFISDIGLSRRCQQVYVPQRSSHWLEYSVCSPHTRRGRRSPAHATGLQLSSYQAPECSDPHPQEMVGSLRATNMTKVSKGMSSIDLLSSVDHSQNKTE